MLAPYLKQATYSAAMFSISSIIVRLSSFVVLPYFLANLSLAEFGIWDFYQLFFSFGSLALTSSVTAAMTRYYFLYKDDPLKRKQAMGNAFFASLVVSLSFLVLAIIYLNATSSSYEDSLFAYMTLLNVILFSLFCCVLVYVRIRQWLLLYLLLFAGQSVLAQLLTVVGVYHSYGVRAFFYANGISYLVFVPLFIFFARSYVAYSWEIAKEQFLYSTPLLLNNLLYMGFFSIDRLCITYGCGYETLGMYALLWRFGAIVQFLSMAIWDAWLLMIFDAHKNEPNRDRIIAQLINCGVLFLTTLVLGVLVGSRCIISLLFPIQYVGLVHYLPIFLAALLMLELARLLSVGCTLAGTTHYMPLLTCVGLVMQAALALCTTHYGLGAVILGNLVAFGIYCLLSCIMGTRLYSAVIIDKQRIAKILLWFACYSALYHLLFLYNAHESLLIALGMTWPCVAWYAGLISDEEKTRIVSYAIQIKITLFASLQRRLPKKGR